MNPESGSAEELDDAGDLVGFAKAADRDLGDDLVEGFLGTVCTISVET